MSIFNFLVGGEILAVAEPLLERNFHPTVIVSGYLKALQVCSEESNLLYSYKSSIYRFV